MSEVVTFGCRLNTLESEVIRRNAQAAGLDDAMIFNTCAVTNEAVRQARQAIRRARRDNPQTRIIVTGCAAQTDPAAFASMPEVDRVLGNEEKLRADSFDFGIGLSERVQVNDIMSVRETAGHLVNGIDGRTRAFVQVQNGCDHRCTFCIIPYGRGNSRSVPMGAVVDQVRLLVDSGYQEVVVTGVDITSYGADLPGAPSLGTLCDKILKGVPALERLRLSSIDSVEVDPMLMELIAGEPRLMPHLHLSLQAGDDITVTTVASLPLRHHVAPPQRISHVEDQEVVVEGGLHGGIGHGHGRSVSAVRARRLCPPGCPIVRPSRRHLGESGAPRNGCKAFHCRGIFIAPGLPVHIFPPQ